MRIVYKMNYSQFLLRRGIFNIFGKNWILYFSVIAVEIFAELENNVPIYGVGSNFVCVFYIQWTIHNFT